MLRWAPLESTVAPENQMKMARRFFLALALPLFLGMAVHATETHKEDLSSDDPALRQRIIGTWEDDYQGRRTMFVREDGTATMVVELTGLKAALYARRLQFEMIWSISNARLRKQTVGGQPAGKVQTILRLMGDRVDEQIVELTNDRLVLLDQNGKRKYEWRRAATAE
jgi:hypothetical protein